MIIRTKEPEKVRLTVAVISDIHINLLNGRTKRLHRGLRDMDKAAVLNNALVCVGDTTDRGIEEDWKRIEEIFSAHKPADNIIIAFGNHDECPEGDFARLYKEYSGRISGREKSEPWFSEKIGGYSFIVLANDVEAGLSERQFEWFEKQMDDASKDKKPIFVFMHESLNISHGLPYTWQRCWDGTRLPSPYRSGIGETSDAVEAVMKKYDNVFFFSGHIHLGLIEKRRTHSYGFSNFETEGSFHRINVPCFTLPNHHGLPTTGLGYQLEVYDDKVLIRPRRYTHSVWYSRYNKEFKLTK